MLNLYNDYSYAFLNLFFTDCQNYYPYMNCVFPTQGVGQDTLDMTVICLAVIQTTA